MLDLTHFAGLALLLTPLMIALIYGGSWRNVTPRPPEASDIGMSRGCTLSLDVAWLAAAPGNAWYYDLTLANLLIITTEPAF